MYGSGIRKEQKGLKKVVAERMQKSGAMPNNWVCLGKSININSHLA